MSYGAEVATHLYGAHFPGHVSLEYTVRALQFVGKDNQLSLIRLADQEYFTIRMHDQQHPGGYPLAAGFAFAAEVTPFVVTDVSQLPTTFDLGVSKTAIDLDISGGDLDLTPWMLDPAQENIVVRIRKIDTSPNKLLWTDHLGIEYSFPNRRGEFITLLWSSEYQTWFIW